MAAAVPPSTISDLPPEGVPLREALELCPFWPEHERFEMGRIRRAQFGALLTPPEWMQLINYGKAAWGRVIGWFRDQLENGGWVLEAYQSEKLSDEPVQFHPAATRHLSFKKDYETVLGPNGQLFLGARVYSAKTMASEQERAEPVRVTDLPAQANKARPQSKIPLIELLQGAIVKIPFPPPAEQVPPWKRNWSTKVAAAINERHRKEPNRVRPTTPGSVQARMSQHKLWPEFAHKTPHKLKFDL
jgi:hypothetical protein